MRKKIGLAIEQLSDDLPSTGTNVQDEIDLKYSLNNTFTILNDVEVNHSQVDLAVDDLNDLDRLAYVVDGKVLDEPTIDNAMIVLEGISNRLAVQI